MKQEKAPEPLARKHHVGPWLEARLRQDILEGKVVVGNRVFSAERLAVFYGVDKMTANRAVQTLARDGILRVQRGSGTFLNVPRQTRKAGLLFYQSGELHDRQDEYGLIAREILIHLKKSGYACEVMGLDLGDPESVYGPSVGRVTAKQFDLLITLGIMHKPYIEQLLWLEVPVVAVDFAPGLDRVSSVSMDSFNMGYDAARILLDHGHRRFLFAPYFRRKPHTNREYYRERDSYLEESGWRCALSMTEAECHYLPNLADEAALAVELKAIWKSPEPPTAVFGTGNIGRLNACLAKVGVSLVRDLSVIWTGWDEIVVEGVRIARFDLDWTEMARETVSILEGLAARKSRPVQRLMVNARFHPGQSVHTLKPAGKPAEPPAKSGGKPRKGGNR